MAPTLQAALQHKRSRAILFSCVFLLACFVLIFHPPQSVHRVLHRNRPHTTPTTQHHDLRTKVRLAEGSTFDRNAKPVPCAGARGSLLNDPQSQDIPHPEHALPNITYPLTTMGSYEAMNLEKSWMTAEQRYGPYGYEEDKSSNSRTKVDWTKVSWGKLQNECYAANTARFDGAGGKPYQFSSEPRFRYINGSAPPTPPTTKSGRTAIVIRTWSTYDYQPEDFWNLRSIVTEASLGTGGEFAVILLVDVKDEEKGRLIHTDDDLYREVLEASVPAEFRSIAVLFHYSLQQDWYAKADEIRPFWQIMQPFQLLAHFYPEFDHFWQFESDTRFTGDVGKLLSGFHTFGRSTPYKQARERASWSYMPQLHGTYEEFSSEINRTMEGGATVWGPVNVDNFQPIGVRPPVDDPKDDDFKFGVDVDADLLLPSTVTDVNKIEKYEDWMFKDWHPGFDDSTQRYMSVPAQARASWDLLEGIHTVQQELGAKMPSEGTLPSFAFWLGLKVVGLPLPIFMFPERDLDELNFVLNGGYPDQFKDGIAHGPGKYRSSSLAFFTRPVTFNWWSTLADPVYQYWMGLPREVEEVRERKDPVGVVVPDQLPPFMAESGGKVYCPNLMLHPRKTNKYRAPE